MRNAEALRYSFEHRQAIAYVAQKRFGDDPMFPMLEKEIRFHDLDKMYLYTLVDKKSASAYHKATSHHHLENNHKMSKLELMEAICDWECAAYTKPDKPNNAFDAIKRLKPNHSGEMLTMLANYGMAYSYDISCDDDDWISWDGRREASEANIMKEIELYKETFPDDAANLERVADAINHVLENDKTKQNKIELALNKCHHQGSCKKNNNFNLGRVKDNLHGSGNTRIAAFSRITKNKNSQKQH